MWWETNAQAWGPSLTLHNKAVYRSARNSLQLRNPSADPASVAELSQTAAIVPGVKYRLSAWAMSAHDPQGVELALAYLDGYGDEIAVSRTTGNASGINPTAFKQMSVVMTAPPTAIAARVTVRLAGGRYRRAPARSPAPR